MKQFLLFFWIIFLTSCFSEPLKGPNLLTEQHILDANYFQPSKTNKYAIILEGHNSTCDACTFSNNRLDSISQPIPDIYLKNDISETARLAIFKGYDTYILYSVQDVENLFDSISLVANEQTQLLVAMSGEGDEKGFIFNLVHHISGLNVVPPNKKLDCPRFNKFLNKIPGIKAIIINACQSGCFVDELRKNSQFKGVVIAACAVGYSTTNCEQTQTSAIYAGFLNLYQDDPKNVENLAIAKIKCGFWFENCRHKISDIGQGGYPISYDPVIYSTADFLF